VSSPPPPPPPPPPPRRESARLPKWPLLAFCSHPWPVLPFSFQTACRTRRHGRVQRTFTRFFSTSSRRHPNTPVKAGSPSTIAAPRFDFFTFPPELSLQAAVVFSSLGEGLRRMYYSLLLHPFPRSLGFQSFVPLFYCCQHAGLAARPSHGLILLVLRRIFPTTLPHPPSRRSFFQDDAALSLVLQIFFTSLNPPRMRFLRQWCP